MTNIFNLGAERERRNGPDPEWTRRDLMGRKEFCFSAEYRVGERVFSSEVWAASLSEAEAHAAALRKSFVVIGLRYVEAPDDGHTHLNWPPSSADAAGPEREAAAAGEETTIHLPTEREELQ